MNLTLLKEKGRYFTLVVLAVGAAMSLLAYSVYASTTISTNVSTGGTLSVTGLSSLSNASSTMLSANTAYFGQSATSTFDSAGDLSVAGTLGAGATTVTTLHATGLATLDSGITLTGSETVSSNLTTTGTASSTKLVVGSGPANTVSGIAFGYCTITANVSVSATSTAYADCTTNTAIVSGDRVFVEATSSMPAGVLVEAATSTASTNINLLLVNATAGTSKSVQNVSLNFWAVR